ncbi:MAG: tRNA (adenosine(37)-N6)-threonylcarbamoyltransferase complex dimerization subunit type 1 TsaB [Verrucomicrobia bacterium]|nr:tRNA (adenosine(37)-N6)-threonylcarbamoyltransferase complex dimerization subunit type 1 TsaB [Verrucomicrobiota bacterium]MBU1733656.1 tRNA (adenosine(37)-N6)-threonylcarbamoyltransferase complex dimerization subunit type 1 TsaB [Verrucomicrobiota bacterium]MBU1857679.1 tRNA (adenosine(37)-N6)-threonylcarbamoyltransferase complex dimerization subunit type 1 TsaB [Verrucomicrobiota bacterium]
MLILSIDQSTETGSAAILDDQRLVAARHWAETHVLRQQLLPSLKAMLMETGLEPGAIQLYVVGVGPGSYSGLRVALTAARAMALPGKTPVYGITSAEVLAWQTAEAAHVARVRIVGDARRDQWWTRCFRRRDAYMSSVGDWALVHPRAFQVGEAEAVATPDWARIGALLQAAVPPVVTLIARAFLPDAATLGRLAMARMAQGVASEPLMPIYLHPAVQAKPDPRVSAQIVNG